MPDLLVEEERSFHVLIACNHATILRGHMRKNWPLAEKEKLVDIGREWLLYVLAGCTEIVRGMVIILIWCIWPLRNDLPHDKQVPPIETSVEFLDNYWKSLLQARRYSTEEIIKGEVTMEENHVNLKVKPIPVPVSWPAPSANLVALSVDGSFTANDGCAGASMILRSVDGTMVFAAYRVLQPQ